MKERPILFRASMVRAILAGEKMQTRRIVKLPHQNPLGEWQPIIIGGEHGGRTAAGEQVPEQGGIFHTRTGDGIMCPCGQPGDRLWVRETYRDRGIGEIGHEKSGFVYRATENKDGLGEPWRPSIHMPRKASRILLEITGVRVEKLQDISEQDAIAEGIEKNWTGDPSEGQNGFGTIGWVPDCGWINYMEDMDGDPAYTPRDSFRSLWQSINGRDSWAINPWLWVVEFRRIEP